MIFKSLPVALKIIASSFLISTVFMLAYSYFSVAKDLPPSAGEEGKKIFKNCAGCHLKGLNLIKEDKPIIGSKKLKSVNEFKEFISNPPPPMPNFKNIADNPEKLNALYSYVVSIMASKK